MKDHFDVIVVGGGLAGLAAGATAAAGGASTVVLEAHQPGGRARTTVREGFVFNHGIHALFTGGPGMRMLDALGARPTGTPPPIDRYMILAGGRLDVLPLGHDALDRSTYLDGDDKAQLAVVARHMAEVDPTSLEGVAAGEWLAGHALRPRVDGLLRALLRLSTYVADLDQLGADAAIAQQQAAARAGVIYVDDGWSQLVGRLGRKLEVRSGAAVRQVAGHATGVEVETDAGRLTAGSVVVAVGTPQAARAMLPDAPSWPGLGQPVVVACLDVGLRRVPSPGYVVGIDDPLYGSVQSPPAKQAPAGRAVAGVIRYGTRDAASDRADLEGHLTAMGIAEDDVVVRRFLARMTVCGALPLASAGGLAGRPAVTGSGTPRVLIAGDWVGPDGFLADAALASGHSAGLAALRAHGGASRVA